MIRLALLFVLLAFEIDLPDTVRVTEHGARYHAITCPALHGAPGELVRRSSADSAGFVVCRRCLAAPARKGSRWSRLARVKP